MMLCFYACSLVVYSLFSVAIHTPKENSFGQHCHWFSYGHSFWIWVNVVSLLMESLGYSAQNWWLPYRGISVAFWLLMVHASMLLELNGVITKMGCSLGNRMGKFFLGDDDLCHDPNFTRIETTCCPIREWCTSPPDLFSNLNSRSQAWTVHYLGSLSVSIMIQRKKLCRTHFSTTLLVSPIHHHPSHFCMAMQGHPKAFVKPLTKASLYQTQIFSIQPFPQPSHPPNSPPSHPSTSNPSS